MRQDPLGGLARGSTHNPSAGCLPCWISSSSWISTRVSECSRRMLAQTIAPASVHSLDAIHLATAMRMGREVTSFVTYDKRLADAAVAAGLPLDRPA